MFKKLYSWIVKNIQSIINIYLFINILGVILWQVYGLYKHGSLDFIEITFILHNCALAWVVLIRQKHFAIDRNLLHQAIALVAFFSGIAFMGQKASDSPAVAAVSGAILAAAGILGFFTVINLKNSFGILIACRTIKTNGFYRYIRHPMYATDILLRIGYIVSHCTLLNVCLFILSAGCYVWRALLEEKFLCSVSEDYKAYKSAVRYRFIPGIL